MDDWRNSYGDERLRLIVGYGDWSAVIATVIVAVVYGVLFGGLAASLAAAAI